MAQVPTTRIAIFAVLKEHGPLHVSAIAEILKMNLQSVNCSIRIAHKHNLIYISGWKRSFKTKGRMGAIYSLGQGKDCKKPDINAHHEANVRYREKYREVLRLRTNARRGHVINHWLIALGAA